jgi:integrase
MGGGLMPAPRRSDLSTPKARKRLAIPPNGRPYWHPIEEGRALGYRRVDGPGSWRCRYYRESEGYHENVLGLADDTVPADGQDILSFAQALRLAIAWCNEQAAPGQPAVEVVEVAQEPYTVAQAMEDYLQWYRVHRKAAWEVELRIKGNVLPILGCHDVAKLSVRQIRIWHQELGTAPLRMRGGHVRPLLTADDERKRKNTANRLLTILKAALNMAVTEGRVELAAAAAWRLVKPFRGVNQPKIRFFDQGEIDRLLNACAPDFRRLVIAALLTGCRYGELANANVGDYLAASQALQVNGKTGPRVVFLSDEGADFFRSLLHGRSPDEKLFLQANRRPWNKSEQFRPMVAATKAANIPPPNNFHILRHTYASHYLMNGGDLPGLAQQLGHSDTRMTTRHYAHLASQWRLEEARKSALRLGLAPSNVRAFETRRPVARVLQGIEGGTL